MRQIVGITFLLIIIHASFSIAVHAQTVDIDSLENALNEATIEDQIAIHYYLCNYYIEKSPAKTIIHANEFLKIADELDSLSYQEIAYSFLGEAYFFMDNYEKAEEYFLKNLEINIETDNQRGVSAGYNNLGILYRCKNDYEKSIEYYNKALQIYRGLEDMNGISSTYNNLGVLYENLNSYNNALEYYKRSYSIEQELGDNDGIATSLLNIGALYGKMNRVDMGIEYLNTSLVLCDTFGFTITKEIVHESLANLYQKQGDYKDAFIHQSVFHNLKSIRTDEENQHNIAELEISYQTEKKEKEIDALNDQNALQKRISYLFGLLLFIILFFAIFLFRSNKIKKEKNILLHQQNLEIQQHQEEILAQRDEIETQRDEILRQKSVAEEQSNKISKIHSDITDSIEYAKNIQYALFPNRIAIQKVIQDGFCLFMPKDIVSGDFYWLAENNGKKIIAVADCTGHGVPGAFMSIIGINFLNEIIKSKEQKNPAQILNDLRKQIIKALVHSNKSTETKDGMDIALCTIDEYTKTIEYAGAFLNLYHIHDKLMDIHKADRMPVGLSFKEIAPYTNHTIKYKKGDVIYMFSDGYADQFGGQKRKKYRISQLRDSLLEIHNYPMKEQKSILHQRFLKWKDDQMQVDDVLVLGKRL